MALKNYKKWTIAIVFILIIGIVIFAISTSNNKTEKPSLDKLQKNALPSGPLTDSAIQEPLQMDKLPDNLKDLSLLGDNYFEKGMYDKAVQVYGKILEKNPNDVNTYTDMGLALHYIRRSDDAVNILRKGIQIAPSYQRIWLSLGFVLMSTGKNEEAKPALKKALELNPQTDMGQEAMRMLGSLK